MCVSSHNTLTIRVTKNDNRHISHNKWSPKPSSLTIVGDSSTFYVITQSGDVSHSQYGDTSPLHKQLCETLVSPTSYRLQIENINIVDNHVYCLHPGYKGYSFPLNKVSYKCARWKKSCPISHTMFSKWSPISTSTSFLLDTLKVSNTSSCHVHVI